MATSTDPIYQSIAQTMQNRGMTTPTGLTWAPTPTIGSMQLPSAPTKPTIPQPAATTPATTTQPFTGPNVSPYLPAWQQGGPSGNMDMGAASAGRFPNWAYTNAGLTPPTAGQPAPALTNAQVPITQDAPPGWGQVPLTQF